MYFYKKNTYLHEKKILIKKNYKSTSYPEVSKQSILLINWFHFISLNIQRYNAKKSPFSCYFFQSSSFKISPQNNVML